MNGVKQEILPQEGKKNILITSALPYVNNVPHLGNVIGSVLSADVFSRYCKARGHPTLFVCGTDEYGTATETKAIEEGVTPQELCDKYNRIHKEVYDWFEIGFDHFGRTPTTEQTEIAQDIFTKLNENGYLEERTTTQPYCEKHGGFLADRFVEGECPLCGYGDARGDQCDKCGHLLDPLDLKNPRCKLDGATPQARETKHVFILLEKLQEKVAAWSKKSDEEGAWSENGSNITSAWLKEGLKSRGITRDLKWGTPVPLPGYDDKVMYVWFDACIGYVSITATYTKEWQQWWRNPENVSLYQFMGKDNVPFHTVVFPASQLGTGQKWTMLNHLSTTEYLNYEGGKFSKSRGIGVFGTSAKQTGVAADVWRYFLLMRRPETSDTEFQWDGFIAANNNELVANFGNFVNRILKYVNSANYGSVVPKRPDLEADSDLAKSLKAHIKDANEILRRYREEMDAVHLKAGLVCARELSSLGNKLLQDNRLDNALFSNERERCDAVVYLAINHVHLLASVIAPYLPATTRAILDQLQAELLIIPDTWEAQSVEGGHKIGKAAHLFKNILPAKEKEWRELFGGSELKKQKDADAAKKAVKKAEKERKRAQKKAEEGQKKEFVVQPEKAAEKGLVGVESAEKGGQQTKASAGEAVEEVVEGTKQVSLQSS
ncbi:methionine--tRNA ligase mes1 [Meristemomyces frigidus]|nr:methionine--tRNA ligase mes1 [Meristemomyces frigidus]